MTANDTTDENENRPKTFCVTCWVDAECSMEIEALDEEAAIEEAKRLINEELYHGTVSPTGEPSNFQAREW